MILRRPYAFLIKHFKLIHMLLFIGILYVTIKNINLSIFLSNYIRNNQDIPLYENFSSTYAGSLTIFILFLIVLLSGALLYLMKYKKKPFIFYIVNLIVYMITLFLFIYASDFIYNAQFTAPGLRFTKILRDLYFTLIFVHIATLIQSFVRMTGFDIKKFDFQKDVIEFNLSSEDREEFEFELNIDSEDIKAKIRKRLRILKYYYKENKLIFVGLLSIISFLILFFVLDYFISIEKIYKEKESFNTSFYKIQVLDSYKTNKNSRGEVINKDKYYVILKLKYKNNTSNDFNRINVENAKLKVDDFHVEEPKQLVNEYFSEFGEAYYSQSIKQGDEKIFTLIYEIDKKYYNNDLKLRYLFTSSFENNELVYKYRTVKLKPKVLEERSKVKEYKLKEEIDFSGSILGKTKLNINNVKIEPNFIYKMEYCIENNCHIKYNTIIPNINSKYELSVMRIDFNLVYDKNFLGERYKNNKFFETHGNIRFIVNKKEYNHNIKLRDITPYSTNNYVFVEVRSNVLKAEKIYLDLIIRDKIYTYVIK